MIKLLLPFALGATAVLRVAAADTAPATVGAEAPPVAETAPASDSYFGTTLTDNYRWMEGDPSPRLRDFLAASAKYADAQLERVQGRDKILADLENFGVPPTVVSNLVPDGDTLFYLTRGSSDASARLAMRGATGEERVLADPAKMNAGPHAMINQIAPSPEGTYVAFGIESAGPDSTQLRIYDTSRNIVLPERIDGARFAAVSWLPDSTGFYYTAPVDHGTTNRRFLRLGVFLHRLGTALNQDTMVLDAAHLKFPFHAPGIVPRIVVTPGTDYALAVLSDGVSPELTIYTLPLSQVLEQAGTWKPLATQGNGVTGISITGSLAFLLTSDHAPAGRVVTEDLADPDFSGARTILPAGDGVITGIAASAGALYTARRQGDGMELLRLDFQKAHADHIALPFTGTIAPAYNGTGGLVADPRSDGVYFSLESWIHPKTWLRYDVKLHRAVDTKVVPEFPHDLDAFQSVETSAVAKDGTRIPLSLIFRRGIAKDHARPALITAYGSYGYPYDARFVPAALAWADQGGVYAVAHVRGGGEFGQPWRNAGSFANKSNSSTDLLACAAELAAEGYSAPAKTAASGTNAGAIAVAGAMLRQPDAFRAVLLRAGLLNPLRSEEYADGVVNVAEFGSAHDPARFPSLLAMDAYQQVKDKTPYPAVLLTASLADAIVPAWQSAKMAARLAAASSSGSPVLLLVSQDAAPSLAGREQLEAEELSFLLWQLGQPDFAQSPEVVTKAAPVKGKRHKQKA
jgi:prolyl oligopeptidase